MFHISLLTALVDPASMVNIDNENDENIVLDIDNDSIDLNPPG